MLARGAEVSASYITVFIGLFRYNVLRSGANHTECDGSRGAHCVRPSVRSNASQILSPPRLGAERLRSGVDSRLICHLTPSTSSPPLPSREEG